MFFSDIIIGSLLISTIKAAQWGYWKFKQSNKEDEDDADSINDERKGVLSSLKQFDDGKDETSSVSGNPQECSKSSLDKTNSMDIIHQPHADNISNFQKSHNFNRIIDAILYCSDNSINIITDIIISLKKYYLTDCTSDNNASRWVEPIDHFYNDIITHIMGEDLNRRVKDDSIKVDPDMLIDKLNRMRPNIEYLFSAGTERSLLLNYLKNRYGSEEQMTKFADSLAEAYYPILYADNNTFYGIVKEKEELNIPSFKPILNYQTLLGMAGDLYNNLHSAFCECGLIPSKEIFSNELVYEIATKIIERTDFYFCHNLTINQLAHDITDSIIDYIHNSLEENTEAKKNLIKRLVKRYLGSRPIRNYYYYLKMCVKIYESALNSKLFSTDTDQQDGAFHIFSNEVFSFKISEVNLNASVGYPDSYSLEILSEIVNQTKDFNFPFIFGLREEDVMRDILLSFYSRENKHESN